MFVKKTNILKIVGMALCLSSVQSVNAQDVSKEDIPSRRLHPIHLQSESADGRSVKVIKKAVGLQANAALKAEGSPRIPVVLANFSDRFFGKNDKDITNHFDLFFNGKGVEGEYTKDFGCYGSVSEYFRDQSEGKFTPKFDILGPVTLSRGYVYYGHNSGGSGRDAGYNEFREEALSLVFAMTDDWKVYDNSGNGKIDYAVIVFAGEPENYAEADPDNLWPQDGGGELRLKGGIVVSDATIMSEMFRGELDGTGISIHEMSHALGLPDFYDHNYISFGLDYWDIMDSGDNCCDGFFPCGYSAYERDFMGWKPLVDFTPTNEPQTIRLKPVTSGGEAYKIVNPANSNEYLILENRQQESWDTYIGMDRPKWKDSFGRYNHGLMVTHVNYNAPLWYTNSVNDRQNNQGITLLPADGELISAVYYTDEQEYKDYLVSLGGDLFPGRQKVTSLEPERIVWANGETADLGICNIIEGTDGTVSFTIGTREAYKQAVGISDVVSDWVSLSDAVDVYSLSGNLIRKQIRCSDAITSLNPGLYIIGGKKFVVK